LGCHLTYSYYELKKLLHLTEAAFLYDWLFQKSIFELAPDIYQYQPLQHF